MTHLFVLIEGVERAVRYRSRSGMRSLLLNKGPEFYFSPDEARYDHIRLRMAARIRTTNEEELDSVLGLLGEISEPEAIIHSTPRDQSSTQSRYDIYTPQQRWLFSIKGKMKWIPQRLLFSIEADLHINPTRFHAYQQTASLDEIREQQDFHSLWDFPSRRELLSNQALDGGTNVLIGLQHLGGTTFDARADLRRNLLQVYHSKLTDLMVCHWHRPDQNMELEELRFRQVGDAEIYWELYHPDAVSYVADLSAAIARCDALARTFDAPVERDGAQNARWVKLPLTKAIDLKFYAKTGDRVRCEVTYKGRDGRLDQIVRRRLGRDRWTWEDALEALVHDASERIQTAWTTIMDNTSFRDQTADLADFMGRLNECVPDENRRLMLSFLLNHRRVSETLPEGIAPRSVCTALCRVGILRRSRLRHGGGTNYALSPDYVAMFDRLQGRS
ncbi:MAG: hypothetical protein AAGA50_03530 [Pseudomonadota bacterium]